MWRFFEYVTEDGKHLITDWYEAEPPEVQARFDATLYILRSTERWTGHTKFFEHFKVLERKHLGLGEIRFHLVESSRSDPRKQHRRRYRPVGVWPPYPSLEFVMILGCRKVRNTYIPHAALEVALRYVDDLKLGKGGIVEYELD